MVSLMKRIGFTIDLAILALFCAQIRKATLGYPTQGCRRRCCLRPASTGEFDLWSKPDQEQSQHGTAQGPHAYPG
jgi:hypothetical protein